MDGTLRLVSTIFISEASATTGVGPNQDEAIMTFQLKDETKPSPDHKRHHAAKHGLAARMFAARNFDPQIVRERNNAWMEVRYPQDGPIEAFLAA